MQPAMRVYNSIWIVTRFHARRAEGVAIGTALRVHVAFEPVVRRDGVVIECDNTSRYCAMGTDRANRQVMRVA